MNMSSSNKNMLLVFLGLIIVAAAWFLGMSPMMEDKEKIDTEVKSLQAKYTDLLAKSAKQADYEKGIAVYNEKFEEKLAKFPATLDQEYTVEFIDGIREAYEFNATSLALGRPVQFYVLGSSNTATDAAATDAAATDATTTDATAVDPATTNICYTAAFPVAYKGSYDGIKDFLNYIAGYKYRMTVDTATIAYNVGTQEYTGSVLLTMYSVAGPDRSDAPLSIDVETGVSNIFTGEGGSSSSSTLNKYDENDGAAIASDYDFYVMLNPATSDVSPIVVGQDGKDASQVSSDANEAVALKFDFYEKEGKKYVTYTLGDKSYEAEVTSPDDVTIFVNSTDRVDGDDKAAVKVVISNSMGIPVYVKVDGDDATSPRFSVTSKTGQVKIY